MNNQQHFLTKLQSVKHEIFLLLSKTFIQGTMIDVGAHHGVVTELFLSQGWKSYAFEPVIENLKQLKQLLGNNPNLVARSEAVSDSSGYKDFYLALNPDNSLHNFYHSLENIKEDNHHKKGNTIQIKTVSLDDLINQEIIPSKIEFLKIDTEGHDLAVLQGASQLECQVISVEFWCDKHPLGVSPSPAPHMIEILQRRGFDKYIVVERKDAYATSFLYSSVKDLEESSWGNIFFFHSSQIKLYEDVVTLCSDFKSNYSSQQTLGSLIKILNRLYSQDDELLILDVGAYRGDFTSELMHYFQKVQAILFEPSPTNFSYLTEKFIDDSNIKVFNFAISNYNDNNSFYLLENEATNSLLHPINKGYSKIELEIKTLDMFWYESQQFDRLDILKIDTQGNDLKVLEGARQIIRQYSPCILVEAIFVVLYQSQDSYYEMLKLMQEYDYSLIRLFNIHYGRQGQLAFADLFFVPNQKIERLEESLDENFICYDIDYLVSQNQFLQKTCDERLSLINTLDKIAKERLELIKVLDAEIKRLQAKML